MKIFGQLSVGISHWTERDPKNLPRRLRMPSLLKRRKLLAVAAIAAVAIVGVWSFLFYRPPDLREYFAIRAQWQGASKGASVKLSDSEREHFASRCLEVSRKYPGTLGGSSASLLASTLAADTVSGAECRRQFAQLAETADIDQLAQAFDWDFGGLQALREIAPALLCRVRQSPDHPRAARLVAAVCLMTSPKEGQDPPAIYVEAADLITSNYPGSGDIVHFCEDLGVLRGGSPPWAGRFERHLRAILGVNQNRYVRCMAQYALASAVRSSPEDRQDEAEALFEAFRTEFDGKHAYSHQQIEQHLSAMAQRELKELRYSPLGKPAPELTGIDLDGKSLTLSSRRGRVVLLNFWGTWCFPCMKLIPHEVALAKRFQGQPFDLVGVNCDTDLEKARAAVARTKMTWPSFRDQMGEGPTITSRWKILGFPTLYLIDHHGILRKRWVGGPSPEEFEESVGVLVDAAQKDVAADAMKPVVAALRAIPLKKEVESAGPRTAGARRSETGFVNKVHHEADRSESKYVVFIPRTYDGTTALPAIMFLHGSGACQGSDGQGHLKQGLAKAIRDRSEEFPFIVVFPQAGEGEDWTSGSPGGQRALAILSEVMKDYRVDSSRVTLTGLSMGGEGTWSLAAADPERWAAIVPISHGSDTKNAPRLKDVPCWCFHGDADKMIPPQASRDMVQAIREAGGRPLYQELGGVDHNSCADRVYAMPDLFEWMLLQASGKRPANAGL
jgi:thiol-disulfide isomerase/thioredoxin/poly(3-hydroxybutyrate) depolymerase